MIIHLAQDEKFIDSSINNFENLAPQKNILVIFSKYETLKYVKTSKIDYIINPDDFNPKYFLEQFEHIDFIISYSLFKSSLMVIKYASCPVVWLGFGYDYYPLIIREPTKLLQKKTLSLRFKLYPKEKVKFFIRKLIPYCFHHYFFSDNNHLKSNLIKSGKINYFSPVIEPEYDLLKSKFKTNLFPQYVDFSFGSGFTSNEKFYLDIKINGNNILLGNSASFTNNHIEAIDIIAKCIIDQNRKVIAPLSYGNESYQSAIISYGKAVLKSRFEPIVNFLDKEEYFLKISSCSIVLMNHLRQQAVSNIGMMLLFGAKIFLNQQNPLYYHLKKSGYLIYPINDILKLGKKSLCPLTEEQRNHNRNVFTKTHSKKIVLEKISHLINIVHMNQSNKNTI